MQDIVTKREVTSNYRLFASPCSVDFSRSQALVLNQPSLCIATICVLLGLLCMDYEATRFLCCSRKSPTASTNLFKSSSVKAKLSAIKPRLAM